MSDKIGRNDPCPCGSGLKYKKCCGRGEVPTVDELMEETPKYDGVPDDVVRWESKAAPLMEGVPNIFIATPWTHVQISTQHHVSMMNMALSMPFPGACNIFKSRHTADARNAICLTAIKEGYSHILMIDADQYVSDDTFGRLWNLLEVYGHENTIASAWAKIRGGPFKGNTSVLFNEGDSLISPHESILPKEVFQAYSVGTPGLLFCTEVLKKIQPPWFADLLTIDNEIGDFKDEEDEGIVYWPLERRATHDYVFGIRMTEAGVKIMVDPACKLPHEMVEAI